MEPRDVEAACALVRQLTSEALCVEDMRDRLEWVQHSPVDWLFVCEVDGQVQGLYAFRLRERIEHPSRFGEISAIVTDAAARRSGVGRAMMDHAEQMARDTGCIGTWLVSGFKRKDEAHRFYDQLGYEITGYRFVKYFE
ncbi:MAG: GNAT family N-acetyltransferase [Anaerolineae bacterium]|nr:GNAT family N-acetyltransferase [Anaerolineae bacterium]